MVVRWLLWGLLLWGLSGGCCGGCPAVVVGVVRQLIVVGVVQWLLWGLLWGLFGGYCEGWWLSSCCGSVAEYWWLSGRVLVAQAIGVLGLTSGLPFHFPLFLPQFLPLSNHYLLTLLFQREQSHMKELYIPKFLHTVSGHAETG